MSPASVLTFHDDAFSTASPAPKVEQQEVLVEIDKKEALRQGVENMLVATKNSDSRIALTDQLIAVNKELQELRNSLENVSNPVRPLA
jgi:hypothetical protein